MLEKGANDFHSWFNWWKLNFSLKQVPCQCSNISVTHQLHFHSSLGWVTSRLLHQIASDSNVLFIYIKCSKQQPFKIPTSEILSPRSPSYIPTLESVEIHLNSPWNHDAISFLKLPCPSSAMGPLPHHLLATCSVLPFGKKKRSPLK